ncbi:MAG: ATPase, T2SS/T4P/T4SS family [Kocuria sp.]|uniref:CpaF family protein n=1 Tax=Kocuria sp. TaxID=1871328 RepID=UPI0026DAFEE5|nr:ATPase, T2SS/T4P/T4SS family [Kocuria sp.]MDO4256029.1 ATPase, T2SS/T4P/T4SS family [Kocuria sp.]
MATVAEDAIGLIEADVREQIRRTGLDPLHEVEPTRRIVAAVVAEYDVRSAQAGLPRIQDLEAARKTVLDLVAGYGPLQPYLDDPEVEEIWLNGPAEVYVARGGESELTSLVLSEPQVRTLVERMLKSSGRRLDLSSPFVDASLPDGSRLHVVIPDVTRTHWAVNIRKFVARARRLQDLVTLGSMAVQAAEFLHAAVDSGLNVLVSGATQAGKTTMLNCLCAAIGPRERVITVEEVFELKVALRDVVGMQCRQANLEGTGEIPLRRLVKEALRMRPDRLVVGEVREAESLDMLIALNAGLPGMCSIHANSARDAVTKICTLPLLAGENISSAFVVPTVASCFDMVVHCHRAPDGHRCVAEILGVGNRVENGVIETYPVFQLRDGILRAVASEVPAAHKFVRAGYSPAVLLHDDAAPGPGDEGTSEPVWTLGGSLHETGEGSSAGDVAAVSSAGGSASGARRNGAGPRRGSSGPRGNGTGPRGDASSGRAGRAPR